MVRLLERFGRRLGALTQPCSPRDRLLTLPALKKPRQSFRPQLEPLEDRLTPAIFMNFAPIARVAVNPQPLPPSVLVEFDPLVNPASVTAGMSMQQEHLTGVLSKQIDFQPAGAASSAADPTCTSCYRLEVFYSLDTSVTESAVLPSALGDGSVRDTFSLAGTVAEMLVPVAPTTGATWLFNGVMKEQGTFNAAFSLPDPTTGLGQISGQWQYLVIRFGTVFTSQTSWQEQEQGNSKGNVSEQILALPGGGFSLSVSFWQQDVVTACLMQPSSPFHPPGPCITINAAFDTWGSVTDNVFLSQSNGMLQQIDFGTTQYTDSLTETIMMPDGSIESVMENSMNAGRFIIGILVG